MVGRFFEPDEKICLIFDNVSYDKLREIPEFSKRHNPYNPYMGSLRDELQYADMPRAREWADEFEVGIKASGFSEEQIHRYKDADYKTMTDSICNGV